MYGYIFLKFLSAYPFLSASMFLEKKTASYNISGAETLGLSAY